MKVFLIIFFAVGSITCAWGQDALTADPQKMASLYGKRYVDVKGTPFLRDEWEKSSVKMADGTVFSNIRLKYNVADDMPLYQTRDDRIWQFTSPVETFTLGNKETFNKGVGGYYQVLMAGQHNLYKKYIKAVFDQRPYGSSNIERRFKDNVEYYTGALQSPVRIRINRSALSKHFSSDQEKFKAASQGNKLKTEEDLMALFETLNAL